MAAVSRNAAQVLTVGIIGAGEIVRRAHLPVLLNLPDARVAWVYDHSAQKASSLGASYGVQPLHSRQPEELPACDIALIAVPVDVRAPYLRHFAQMGSAVLCEKPFAMNLAQHTDALREFDDHRIACGYMRRFYRSTLTLRRVVAEGWFGPLRALELSEGNRSKGSGTDSSFLDDARFGASRGVLADLGSHGLDMALFISGATHFRIDSCTKVLDGVIDRKVSADISLSGGACGPAGVPLRFGVSWLDRQSNRVVLQFERASVWCDLSPSATVHVGDPAAPGEALCIQSAQPGAVTYNQAFFLEWQDFLQGARARRPSAICAHSALLTTSLLESLLQQPVAS